MPGILCKVNLSGEEREELHAMTSSGERAANSVLNALILPNCDRGGHQDNHLCNRQICEVPRVSMRRSHPHQDSVRLDGILASHRGILVRRRKITPVQDNLNTHTAGPVHESLPPARARELLERFEFIYTPKHGSWLNMAEIEINSLIKQCLDRRIPDIEQMRAEVAAWQRQRNDANQVMRWRFTTDDTRIKLHRLYPTIEG